MLLCHQHAQAQPQSQSLLHVSARNGMARVLVRLRDPENCNVVPGVCSSNAAPHFSAPVFTVLVVRQFGPEETVVQQL
jgi:hypothetical protein